MANDAQGVDDLIVAPAIEIASQQPIEATADDLDEWGPVKEKKKDKKGKGERVKDVDEEEKMKGT